MNPELARPQKRSKAPNDVGSPTALPAFERILLATNPDDASEAALAAAALARGSGGSVLVLCVLETTPASTHGPAVIDECSPQAHKEASEKLQAALTLLRALGVKDASGRVECGIVEDVVLRLATPADFDVVVLGSAKHRRGTNAYVMAHARVPVMTMPSGISL